MADWPQVTVGIATCSGPGLLRSALASLEALDYPATSLEVIVFDNASPQPVAAWANGSFPRVSVLPSRQNLGFAAACNAIARAASGSLLCFVNDDMQFETGFLRELVQAHRSSGAACVGGVVRSADGSELEFAGGALALTGHGAPATGGEALACSEQPVPSLFVSGGAMLIDRLVFLEAGGFADEYFAYYEDVDLGWRLHALGHRAVVAPRARCFHLGHGSEAALGEGGRMRLLERNALLSVLRNFEEPLVESVFAYALALSQLRAELDPARARACEEGRLAALAALPAAERARRSLAERRKLPDGALLPLFREPFRVEIPGEAYAERQQSLARIHGLAELVQACGAAA